MVNNLTNSIISERNITLIVDESFIIYYQGLNAKKLVTILIKKSGVASLIHMDLVTKLGLGYKTPIIVIPHPPQVGHWVKICRNCQQNHPQYM